jgi:membrane protease YdiL (CAAX protease family)
MKRKDKVVGIVKGLSFPIGYTVYMTAFQSAATFLIMGLCFVRALLALAAVPDMGVDVYLNHFMQDYSELAMRSLWFLSALTTVSALLILWFVFNRKNTSFTEYFRFKKAPVKAIVAAALLGLSLFFLVNVTMTAIDSLLNALREALFQMLETLDPAIADYARNYYETYMELMNGAGDDVGMFTVAAIFGAPLIEEMVFRAGPLTKFKGKMPTLAAVLLTSALFALAHGNPLQMVYTFLLGIVCAYLLVKSDSIYPSIICHFAFNGANLIAMAMQALLRTDFWADTPYYDQLCAKFEVWSNATFLIYLIGSALIAIPMLIAGIILLITLRRPVPAENMLLADDLQLMRCDDACVISAEEEPQEPQEQQAPQEPAKSEEEI